MHTVVESVLMLFTNNHPNQSMLVETTSCQSWHVFRHRVDPNKVMRSMTYGTYHAIAERAVQIAKQYPCNVFDVIVSP